MDLLEKYNFDINTQQYKNLLCVICNGILKNPYRSLCDCKYCFNCFERYIAGGENLCPGKVRNCKAEITTILQFIRIDYESIEKIFKIIVKCPIGYCRYRDKLKNISKHINLHQSNQSFIDYSHLLVVDENEFLKKSSEYLNQEMNNFTKNYRKIENLNSTINDKVKKLKSLQTTLNQDLSFLLENLFENDNKIINLQNDITSVFNNQQTEIDKIEKETLDYRDFHEKMYEGIKLADNKIDLIQWDLVNEEQYITDSHDNIKGVSSDFQEKTIKIKRKIKEIMDINGNIESKHTEK